MIHFLWFLATFYVVDSIGNNACIQTMHIENSTGFVFKNCSETAEAAIKWKKEHKLNFAVVLNDGSDESFVLTVNDQCTLKFEGKNGNGHYARWINQNQKTINCTHVYDCDLRVEQNSGLLTEHNEDVGCGSISLASPIDDQWVWTKVQVGNLSMGSKLKVYVLLSEEGEGQEYSLTTSNALNNFGSLVSTACFLPVLLAFFWLLSH
ncbi:hypothetical protein M3Y94_00656300 [Aphelenchoides besseyi]|nr:hypothetical protein M3Y94_00656300 [Aphelenchoides besseyi]KAI6231185.1 hypothetical protein M3Y95_00354800 [Aphelenchoides besseyi]